MTTKIHISTINNSTCKTRSFREVGESTAVLVVIKNALRIMKKEIKIIEISLTHFFLGIFINGLTEGNN